MSRPGTPFPIPDRPEPGPGRRDGTGDAGGEGDAGRERINATDLFDLLPEPDPALVRPSESDGGAPPPRGRGRRWGGRGGGGSGRRRRSWGQRIVLSLLVVVALVASSLAAVGGYLLYRVEQLDRVDLALSDAPPPGAPRNYLLVGSDSRDGFEEGDLDEGAFFGEGAEGSGQRSDTIMVVRVDPTDQSVDVLSVPRDLWVPLPGTGGSQRINAAYADGPQGVVDAIEHNFDLPIHHYVEVDFLGFAGLVDAVGGVPMWFDTAMRDEGSGLRIDSPGCHVLGPEMALAFTRSRNLEYQMENGGWSVDGTGDLGRMSRQQVFMRRAADQVSQLGIGDALTLNRLLDVGIDSVTLDRRLGLGELSDLGRRFSAFDSEAMRTYSLPTYSFRTSGGAAVLGLEEAEAQPVLNVFRGLPPDALAPVQVDAVTVLNGTGVEGRAALVADALSQIGFGVAGTDNADEADLARTRIRHGVDAGPAASLLERHLTDGAQVVADPTLDPDQVVLEVGHDLSTIGRNPRPAPPADDTTTTTTSMAITEATVPGTSEQPTPGVHGSDPVGIVPDADQSCV